MTTLTGSGSDAKIAFNADGISGLTFDAANYLASYEDLLTAYGPNTITAETHYFQYPGVSQMCQGECDLPAHAECDRHALAKLLQLKQIV